LKTCAEASYTVLNGCWVWYDVRMVTVEMTVNGKLGQQHVWSVQLAEPITLRSWQVHLHASQTCLGKPQMWGV